MGVSDSAATEALALQAKMETLLGYLLLGGVLLSLALIVTGLWWRWINTDQPWLDYQIVGMNLYQFADSEARLAWHRELRPRVMVNLGLIVLMLTPYFRVAASMIYFLVISKNWKYASFTAFVLLALTYSLFLRR